MTKSNSGGYREASCVEDFERRHAAEGQSEVVKKASNDAGEGNDAAWGTTNAHQAERWDTSHTVAYYDNDFDFREHAASCAEEYERRHEEGRSGGAEKASNDDGEGSDAAWGTTSAHQAERWEEFHTTHATGNFFKSRRYILKAFPFLLDPPPAEIGGEKGRHPRKVLLEIGCGSGSTCVPILKHTPATTVVLACDCAKSAVEHTRRSVEAACGERLEDFRAFVCDPTWMSPDNGDACTSLLSSSRAVGEELGIKVAPGSTSEAGIADVVLCVFVLSAIMPHRVELFLRRLFDAARPGGLCAFRDYAMYDMPMLRFEPKSRVQCTNVKDADGAAPRLFMRGDGTLSRFFSVETVEQAFTKVGFEVKELRYATVYNINRRTGQRLKRVFVHGVFQRPSISIASQRDKF